MTNMSWVRIFIAGLALFGESALASENRSTIQDNTSFASLMADVASHVSNTDTDSDNHRLIADLQLVNGTLPPVDSYWVFDSHAIPAQQRYLLSFPHAPPAIRI